MFIRFDRIQERDRQTDKQTDGRTDIASRGKKQHYFCSILSQTFWVVTHDRKQNETNIKK